ncbi:hypothetical protein JZK55_19800 [Dissulfurispira thermophila]|uniref:Uncharacterized protein n=2 Tax=root TaxID=1 RepID=A0A7G1H2Z1_9BACT|nr:hypothetical protein [Dissulfurispira thermophila]BCB97058.1 hypothetical protein JZK55_19800 [Dissulfurispira thermophila]
MLKLIIEASKKDEELSRLLERAKEYAEVYLLAKRRQKGCDGMGEMASLKDEFKGIFDELLAYCKSKGYIKDNLSYDIDVVADEVVKW